MASKKAVYTKSLGRKVASSARPVSISKIHVIRGPSNTWSVVVEGSLISIKSALEKRAALSLAKKEAKNKSARLVVVHDKYGNVAERIKVS